LLADLGYKPRGKFKELLHRLEGITRASDLSVRKAIYDQTIKETNDQLLAQTRAREFINFRRRGASDFVGAMVTTIPFFNAYIQGMDVLYRAASGADSSSSVNRAEARKMFWNRAATVLALSTLYAMGKSDDDDYQGDSRLLFKDGERYGYLIFGWGSCSGCDALQACCDESEVEKLRYQLLHEIKWIGEKQEALTYFKTRDWTVDSSYYYEKTKQFILDVIKYLEA